MNFKELSKQIKKYPDAKAWNKGAIETALKQGNITESERHTLVGMVEGKEATPKTKFHIENFENEKEFRELSRQVIAQSRSKDFRPYWELLASAIGFELNCDEPIGENPSDEELISSLKPKTFEEKSQVLVLMAFLKKSLRISNRIFFYNAKKLYAVRTNKLKLKFESAIQYVEMVRMETGKFVDAPFFNVHHNPFIQRAYALVYFCSDISEDLRKVLSYMLFNSYNTKADGSAMLVELCQKLDFSIFSNKTHAEIGGNQQGDPILTLFKEHKDQSGSGYQTVEKENFVTLQNFASFFPHQYDVTSTTRVFDPGSGMHNLEGTVPGIFDVETYYMCQLAGVFSNITKKGGYSIHIDVNKVMDEQPILDFFGFKKLEFPVERGVVLQKVTDKTYTFEEFDAWYRAHMNKKRGW